MDSFIPPLLIPNNRVSGTHSVGRWVDPRAAIDMVVKRKISDPARNQIPVVQPVTSLYVD
jgi:hypothetical protein